ncbi:MAG: lamin tail domain-containing protein, partial [Bacteroidales bacterium]|nr:lamin tail domain-containing protein [Bacteroidales bacterium]
LSSLSITDGGQKLTLQDAENQVIHHLFFKKGWHSEPIKQEGGWSLEMIDPNLPCLSNSNWGSSVSETGGTPGQQNSISAMLEDLQAPEIDRVTLLDSTTIRIFFSEPVHPVLPISTALFTLSPTIQIQDIEEVPPEFSALDIHLATPMLSTTTYTIHTNGELCDCAQNNISANSSHDIGVSSRPVANDIVINEVLSHPFNGSDADYIEIYNRSNHIIDLKDVKIGSGGDTLPSKAVKVCSSGSQLFPQSYCCICKNKQLTLQQYLCRTPQVLLQNDSLPSYANENGVVFLCDNALRTIDRFQYDESMHYSELLSTEGVSLERVHINRPTQDASNWHSAAFTSGFGTPGYENSQGEAWVQNESIRISPEVFSPDNDGFEDFAEIGLTFSEGENRLTIEIYNERGSLVKHLVNNELCGISNTFRWDGQDDDGNLLPSGLYIVAIRYWNVDGKAFHKKKVVAIRR